MLKWIVGSKADHPLADIRQVRDMLAELPANDSVKSLSDITGWLESLVDVDSFKLDRLYEVIDTLDTAAKTPQLRVVQDYLGMPVLEYITNDEAAAAYLYLVAYPPRN